MSMIVPAGNKNVVWSPKDQNLTKTAAVGAQEEVNPLYEAAKKFAMDNECPCEKSEVVEVAKSDSASSGEKSESSSPFGGEAKSDAKPDAKSDKALPFETNDKGPEAGSSEKAKEAVEKIEEAVVEIKEICDVKSDDKGVAEGVTLEVGESKPMSDSIAIDVPAENSGTEIPGVVEDTQLGGDILEKKSEPCAACGHVAGSKKETKVAWNFDKKSDSKSDAKSDKKSDAKSDKKSDEKSDKKSDCSATTEVGMDKSASTEEEFTKFAKLSPVNKKKVADYWVNMLGFPKDYVALMTKDYEK